MTTMQTGSEQALARKPEPQTGPMTMRNVLEQKKEAIRQVCAGALRPDKLIKLAYVAASRTPKLMECTPLSFLNCIMQCGELGLAPGVLGNVYLIPFRNNSTGVTECTMIVGYRGLVELARRSGKIQTIQANVVRDGDKFEYRYGLHPDLIHEPKADPGAPITYAYAAATFIGGGFQFEVMRKADIDAIRSKSKAGTSGPWKDHYSEMAKKTAIRRLCKLLPLTPEVEAQIAVVDNTEFNFDAMEGVDAAPAGAAGTLSRLGGDTAPEPGSFDGEPGIGDANAQPPA